MADNSNQDSESITGQGQVGRQPVVLSPGGSGMGKCRPSYEGRCGTDRTPAREQGTGLRPIV